VTIRYQRFTVYFYVSLSGVHVVWMYFCVEMFQQAADKMSIKMTQASGEDFKYNQTLTRLMLITV